MSDNNKFKDQFPGGDNDSGDEGEWTVYNPPGSRAEADEYRDEDIPADEGILPVQPIRNNERHQAIEGYEDIPAADPGYEYMSGERLDNDGYGSRKGRRGGMETERDYRPVRFRRDRRIGCLGGVMYSVFVISVSVILTCVGWMAANDVLALNKVELESTVELPKYIFSDKDIDVKDDEGNVISTEKVQAADIDYVADQLRNQGLIEYKFLFKLYAKFSKADLKVDPGTYNLSTNYDYRALITKMQAGSESQERTKITFPEGFTMRQIFERLEENEICTFDDLMDVAANNNFEYYFLENIELGDASRLEGFLFPDTYEFYEGMGASTVIRKFLDTMNYKLTAEMLNQAESLSMSIRDILNIAAMIEKEAAVVGDENDRALVSSVIHNRLRRGMKLGIDATTLYSYPEHKGAPTTEMLEKDDPYNTRQRTGLTPTPICNPGIAAIKAALQPTSSNMLFYALDTASGMHRFFTNESEFLSFTATQVYE